MRHDVGRLVHDLAVAPYPIARHIGADVEVEPKGGDARITDVGHADDRAWFRIELAEAMKCARELLGQDRKVALDIAVGNSGRRRGHAIATGQTGLNAGKDLRITPEPLCRQNSHLIGLPIISTKTSQSQQCYKV